MWSRVTQYYPPLLVGRVVGYISLVLAVSAFAIATRLQISVSTLLFMTLSTFFLLVVPSLFYLRDPRLLGGPLGFVLRVASISTRPMYPRFGAFYVTSLGLSVCVVELIESLLLSQPQARATQLFPVLVVAVILVPVSMLIAPAAYMRHVRRHHQATPIADH